MKNIKKIIAALLSVVLLLPITVSASSAVVEFSDLDGYGWAKESIENLHNDGIFKGTRKDMFSPSGYLRVAELAMTLYRIARRPKAEKTWKNYTVWNIDFNRDYPSPDVWYYDASIWAVENGIIELSNTNEPFMEAVTRAFPKQDNNTHLIMDEMQEDINENEHFPSYALVRRGDIIISMFFYAEYAKKDTSARGDISGFSDYGEITDLSWRNCHPINNVHYFRTDNREWCNSDIHDYLSWAVAEGILEGYPDGSLLPFEYVTRAEYAVMLERFVDYLNK